MANVAILLLCGMPAAGKSTFSKQLLDAKELLKENEIDEKKISFVVLNYDEFMPPRISPEEFQECGDSSYWKLCREAIFSAVEKCVSLLNASTNGSNSKPKWDASFIRSHLPEAIDGLTKWTPDWIEASASSKLLENILKSSLDDDGNLVLVIDDNMFYRSMRYRYLQLSRQCDIGFCQVALDVPVEEAICRDLSRATSVGETTVVKMHRLFEWPDPDRHTWERHSLSFNSSGNVNYWSNAHVMKQVYGLIRSALNSPEHLPDEEEQNISRKICVENVMHQADQTIRKDISRRMREMSSSNLTGKRRGAGAKQLNDSRKRLLQNIRQDETTLSHLNSMLGRDVIQQRGLVESRDTSISNTSICRKGVKPLPMDNVQLRRSPKRTAADSVVLQAPFASAVLLLFDKEHSTKEHEYPVPVS